jgi:hypothetical protein
MHTHTLTVAALVTGLALSGCATHKALTATSQTPMPSGAHASETSATHDTFLDWKDLVPLKRGNTLRQHACRKTANRH